MTNPSDAIDQPGQALVEQFCETWRDWESRVLKVMHRHLTDVIPEGRTLKTLPQAGRLLRAKNLWDEPGGVERLKQYQRLCEEIETRGVERLSELTRQQARRLQAFVALDKDDQRDLLPISFLMRDWEQAKMLLEAIAEKLRESAASSRNPFVDAVSREGNTITIEERKVRDRGETNRSDGEDISSSGEDSTNAD